MNACWLARSSSSSSTIIKPARLPNRRNTVPLPTPAAAAMSSMVTASAPRSAISRRAASSNSGTVARGVAALLRHGNGQVADRVDGAHKITVASPEQSGPWSGYIMRGCIPTTEGKRIMPDTKVLALVGSLRAASINRQIAELAAEVAPDGVAVTIFEGLGDLPFYNEDIDDA